MISDAVGAAFAGSHPVRGAWIEIGSNKLGSELTFESHPVRGAWIEIFSTDSLSPAASVAPRQGCVD